MEQMTTEQAMQNIRMACEEYKGKYSEHIVLQQSLALINSKLNAPVLPDHEEK